MKLNKLKDYLPGAAALFTAALIGISLSGYEAPVYELLKPERVEAAQREEDEEKRDNKKESAAKGNFDLADGIYEGTGVGYKSNIKVAVQIEEKAITDIQILSSGDDAAFFNRAKAVIENIISTQSYEVDVVSGATYSSRGILNAVKNALTGEVDTNTAEGLGDDEGLGDPDIEPIEETGTYKDGTYYGSAVGFAGPIKVEVVIKDGKIDSITIVSTSDGSSYIAKAKSVISKMIALQSTNVDTVSGATYSSAGIINAVRDALSQAAAEPEEIEERIETEAIEEPVIPGEEGNFPYKNGTYYGTAKGFKGNIKIAMKIKNKTITELKVISYSDDEAFFSRAVTLLDEIIKKQIVDVDIVSGATYSSKGLIGAVKAAINSAKAKTEGKEETETPEETEETEETVEPVIPVVPETEGTFLYADGTYLGTGMGFNGDITVAVVIENQVLKAIKIRNAYDDEPFITRAANGIIVAMVEGQTLDVDTVSGATYSSHGIIDAVKDALSRAKENVPEETEEPAETETEVPEEPVETETEVAEETEESETYIYSVSAMCEPDENEDFDAYLTTMTVSVKDGKIISITDIQGDGDSDNEFFLNRAAKNLLTKIIKQGNTEGIDTVSGATCSSHAILEAAENALQKAGSQ